VRGPDIKLPEYPPSLTHEEEDDLNDAQLEDRDLHHIRAVGCANDGSGVLSRWERGKADQWVFAGSKDTDRFLCAADEVAPKCDGAE
jgi:hypothetical protein